MNNIKQAATQQDHTTSRYLCNNTPHTHSVKTCMTRCIHGVITCIHHVHTWPEPSLLFMKAASVPIRVHTLPHMHTHTHTCSAPALAAAVSSDALVLFVNRTISYAAFSPSTGSISRGIACIVCTYDLCIDTLRVQYTLLAGYKINNSASKMDTGDIHAEMTD